LRMLSLGMDASEAYRNIEKGLKKPVYKSIVDLVADGKSIPQKELCYMTGADHAVISKLLSRGVLKAEDIGVYRRPQMPTGGEAPAFTLNEEQSSALEGLIKLAALNSPKAALLHGVTGSGKTNVYIRLIQNVLKEGRGALVLVPEISLTPQLLRLFFLYFGDRVAVIHSALSAGERIDEWKRIKEGEANVVVGTRSAVFAPVNKLGLIIIDEEQEGTYKSENTPRYHARDIAKFRCVQNNALLLMGSATPSIETYYSAKSGKIELFELKNRFLGTPLPDVIVSDMRGVHRDGFTGVIGPVLFDELQKNINRGEQSILFINRRGNSRLLTCAECGYIPSCSRCSVALSYHSANGRLMCHYCGYSEKLPEICPSCGSRHLKYIGCGTQKVEEELKMRLGGAKVIRMDSDTTGGKQSHEKLLDRFASKKYDILLGTQMIAKGLDFENVTLVGILDADLMLYSDDYRASERAFSLLTQVAGRAGRRDKPGRAVIQTYTPQNPVILAAKSQDYEGFYDKEIKTRKALDCPPFTDIVLFALSGEIEHDVLRSALRLSLRIAALMKEQFSDICAPVLGPVQAPVLKVNRRYRYLVSFRANSSKRCRAFIFAVLREFLGERQNRGVSIFADINPLDQF
ncbi:MAG: primosomal protein N', partial [Bacillota bacterium]|nr:primosomal protein N' [Bacillota bacterium]